MNGKIPIYTDRLYELTNSKNREIERLFDDRPSQKIALSTGLLTSPFEVWYEFPEGQDVTLERIELVDGQGTATSPTNISVITSEEAKKVKKWDRISVYDFYGKDYNKTISYTLPTPLKVKYLVITVVNYFVPDKLFLYGSYNENYKVPDIKSKTPKPFKNSVGLNFFSWNIMKNDWDGVIDDAEFPTMSYCSVARHYHDWGVIQPTENKLDFDEKWSLKAMYKALKNNNIDVIVCLKKLPTWIMSTYPKQNLEYVPVDKYGLSKDDPISYTKLAQLYTYFTAAFGRNKVDKSIFGGRLKEGFMWDNPTNRPLVVETGLDYVKHIELGNETDAWWLGVDGYQSPYQFAARASACYDGHKGTLGANIGIKVIDPTMKVVMAGTAMSKLDYLRAVIDWCKQYRGYRTDGTVDIPFDEWNYHIYANTEGNEQYTGKPKKALHPEVANIDKVLQKYYNFQAELGISVPVYITETGYDNNQSSPQAPNVISGKTNEKVVADWILRTSLIYSRLGLDGLTYYMLADAGTTFGTGQYQTSGFKNTDGTLRLNAKWLRQAKELIGEYTYIKSETVNNAQIDTYKKDADLIYVAWMPTDNNSTALYTKTGKTFTTYTLSETGSIVKQGNVSQITIGETPIFFKDSDGVVLPPPPPNPTPTPTSPIIIEHFKGDITFKINGSDYILKIDQ